MGIAHGSVQAAASWPKLNGLINVLDGAGTDPGLSLIVARAFAASFRSNRISARGVEPRLNFQAVMSDRR
jgi:hypothetical protein